MDRSAVINIFKKLKPVSKPSLEVPHKVWRDPVYFAAFGLGSGAMPFAPGTFGTIMAIPIYLMVSMLPLSAYICFVILFFIASCWICDKVSKEIHIHDHPGMCLDEFSGFFVTMIHAPHGWQWIVLGFILFRFFDIWKPWPIYILDEKVHGGFGMVLDDVLAGVYAMIVIQVIALL